MTAYDKDSIQAASRLPNGIAATQVEPMAMSALVAGKLVWMNGVPDFVAELKNASFVRLMAQASELSQGAGGSSESALYQWLGVPLEQLLPAKTTPPWSQWGIQEPMEFEAFVPAIGKTLGLAFFQPAASCFVCVIQDVTTQRLVGAKLLQVSAALHRSQSAAKSFVHDLLNAIQSGTQLVAANLNDISAALEDNGCTDLDTAIARLNGLSTALARLAMATQLEDRLQLWSLEDLIESVMNGAVSQYRGLAYALDTKMPQVLLPPQVARVMLQFSVDALVKHMTLPGCIQVALRHNVHHTPILELRVPVPTAVSISHGELFELALVELLALRFSGEVALEVSPKHEAILRLQFGGRDRRERFEL